MAASRDLLAFADAVVSEDARAIARTGSSIRGLLGEAALADAAAVIAGFSGISRIADATGVPLEDDKAADTVELRAQLGIGAFAEAKF